MAEDVTKIIKQTYQDDVVLGYIQDIIAAQQGVQSEGVTDGTTGTSESGYVNYTQPAGSGSIKLPTGNRATYQDQLIKQVVANNYAGFVQADPNLLTFSNGSWQNSFTPDFARHLNIFSGQMISKLGIKKMTVTSGFRTPKYNREMHAANASGHGATYSPHMAGIAVDYSLKGDDRYTVADGAYYYGFGGIAVGRNFVHIDISVRCFWTYPGVPKYTGPRRN